MLELAAVEHLSSALLICRSLALPAILDLAGKASFRQTIQLIWTIKKLQRKKV